MCISVHIYGYLYFAGRISNIKKLKLKNHVAIAMCLLDDFAFQYTLTMKVHSEHLLICAANICVRTVLFPLFARCTDVEMQSCDTLHLVVRMWSNQKRGVCL